MKLHDANRVHLVADRILAHAERAPDKAALVVGDRTTSYGSLLEQAEGLAATLAGGAPAPQVGILSADPLQLLTAIVAADLTGGTAVVYDPTWTNRQLKSALQRVRVDTTVADPAGRRRLQDMSDTPASLRPGTEDPAARAMSTKGPRYFYVGYTSGTSGTPKAFARACASWLYSFQVATEQFGLRASDWVLIPGALHHSLFLFGALHCLWMGATACILRRFDPGGLVRALEHRPVSRIWAVPTMLAAAEPHLRTADSGDLQRVQGVYCSGSGWPPVQRRRCEQAFSKAEVVEFYGASELSFVAFSSSRDPSLRLGHLRAFPGVELAVRPGGSGREGDGDAGLIYVRSPMLFSGYLSPEPEGFVRDGDGWVTVGDIGRLAGEGALEITGRATSTLICGGQNLQPEPIETCLEQLDEIAEAVVVGISDRLWGQRPVALVRWQSEDRPLPRGALTAHCRRELGPGARPHDFRQIQSIPRTPSGKIARSQLQHRLLTGRLPTRAIT